MAQHNANITFGSSNNGFQAGIVNGSINYEHHAAAAERPETPPNPSCNIPFGRDPNFVDRGSLLDQIHEKCAKPGSRVALVGLGGVGKSQLAIEYSYRRRDESQDTWIFWVHGSNAARYEQSVRDIADQIKLPDRKDPQKNIYRLMQNWLRDSKNKHWVLVLDNVDDIGFFLQPPKKENGSAGTESYALPLWSYLPENTNGSILITSRNKDVASELVGDDSIIPVDSMDPRQAVELVRKRLGGEMDEKDALDLAMLLDCMPLALACAASFIRQRAPRCSIRQYIDKYCQNDRTRMQLLNHTGARGDLRRDLEAHNSILATLQISFDQIHQARPSAADLLSLMSFFDRQGIPKHLLRRPVRGMDGMDDEEASSTRDLYGRNSGSNTEDYHSPEPSNSSAEEEFEEDIRTLRNYALITTTNADGTRFEMHQLVQLATKRWLESREGEFEQWMEEFISHMIHDLSTPEFENWDFWRVLFPHVKSAWALRPRSGEFLLMLSFLLLSASEYASDTGNLDDAERMIRRSIQFRETLLGQEDPKTLDCILVLGEIHRQRGSLRDSEELLLRAHETASRVLAENSFIVSILGFGLCSTYIKMGKYKEAEELVMASL